MQQDLFISNETERLALELDKLKKDYNNARRGLFARFNELSHLFLEQQKELQILKEKVNR